MTDNWKSYICRVNESLASIFVNLGLRDEVPCVVKTMAALGVGPFSISQT